MDEALYYLLEAQSFIDSFVDISLADSFFEDTDEAKDAVAHNEKAKTGAIASLKKAFHAMIEAIKNIINNIADFFRTRALTPEEKKRYEEFKQMVKSDPDFAKQKITIDDWKEYEKAYDEALKELEAEANKPNPSSEIIDKVVAELTEKIKGLADKGKGVAGRAAMSVTLSTAVDIADQNATCAKAINLALKQELISLEDIEKTLGADAAAKFEKKIERAAKNGFLHRARVRIFKHKERTFEAIIKKQYKNLLSFTNIKNGKVKDGKAVIDGGSVVNGIVKNKKTVDDALGGSGETVKLAKNIASGAVKAKMAQHRIVKKAKEAKKEADDFKTFWGIGKK